MQNEFERLLANSYLAGGNVAYIETLYENYLSDPSSVSPEWRNYFDLLPAVNGYAGKDYSHALIQKQFLDLAKKPRVAASSDQTASVKGYHVAELVEAYRQLGHLQANLDPLGLQNHDGEKRLTLEYHDLTTSDNEQTFLTDTFFADKQQKLSVLQEKLKKTYCGNIGFEYMHLESEEEIVWLQERIESVEGKPELPLTEKQRILQGLSAAEGLEKYLGKRYVGQKRFSLEGGGSLIPALDELIQRAGQRDVKEIVIGMAHRGRLNVLINTLGKAPQELFSEFEGKHGDISRSGDVKYHMGFSSDVATSNGQIHLTLAFNPSHLEIISPVVLGSVRARQHRRKDVARDQVVPVLIHGDAAFAGQGVVMESLNMSLIRGYRIGGAVHIVLNNQVGFTTSNPEDARSTRYCTDLAKMLPAPVFHVNGDDPEAVYFITQLAFDYRMRFHKDIFIDLICYRRHGHNEADEPAATQPLMYQAIKKHLSPEQLYAKKLIEQGLVTQADVDNIEKDYRAALDVGHPLINVLPPQKDNAHVNWDPYLHFDWKKEIKTGVSKKQLQQVGSEWLALPEDFTVQPQVARELDHRKKMLAGELSLNWGFAENMAYATLLAEGHSIRMTGQDCRRGTFSHRHAALHDQKTGAVYTPLEKIAGDKADFAIYDSFLSEEAVLGFEYGYACSAPEKLVLWEAQFGDFVNGAQVIIDQFLSSGEQKWGRLCGLVLLLPHGYEGAGPEHSSARLERFLQLCAEKNLQVCVPTTPAQIFHLLRRQLVRPYRKPLIIMSPKSLLRHKLATSSLDELSDGKFQLLIPEIDKLAANKVTRIVLCSGKVYYDLLEKRREEKLNHVAIIRIEQLYPFPESELAKEFARYPNATEIVWCQEEPRNQGVWYPSRHHMQECLTEKHKLMYAGRPRSASPAAGYLSLHLEQQRALVNSALGLKLKG